MAAPSGFSWIEKPLLAALARPAGPEDLRWLREQGIEVLLSLTEERPRRDWIEDAGLLVYHEPLEDMEPPEQDQLDRCVSAIVRANERKMGVAVHCGAGLGRTGVVVAAYFVAARTQRRQRHRAHSPPASRLHRDRRAGRRRRTVRPPKTSRDGGTLMESVIRELFTEICRIPLIDPHSHINPHRPASRTLDDILGYHYYTELAHSAGMDQAPLAADVEPRERVRAILAHMDRFDNTAQYAWFLEIARTFLGFQGERVTAADTRCSVRRRRAVRWPSPTGKNRCCAAPTSRRSS